MYKIIKNKFVYILLLFALTSSVVFATTMIKNNEYLSKEKIEEHAIKSSSSYSKMKDDEDLQKYAKKIKSPKTSLSEEEYLDLYSYILFISKFNPSVYEKEYIDSLLDRDNGIGMNEALSLYSFWITTNENIEVIDELIKNKEYVKSESWIEPAYEIIRKNRGDWNSIDFKYYIEQGLTSDDVKVARILERKGVLTANEILDKALDKKDWGLLFKEVYEGAKTKPKQYVNTKSNGLSSSELLNIQNISSRYDLKLEDVQKSGYNIEKLENARDICESKQSQEITKLISELGYKIGIEYMDEESRAAINGTLELVVKNGLSEDEINALDESGYSPMEILNISEIIKAKKVDLESAVKMFDKEDNRYEKTEIVTR